MSFLLRLSVMVLAMLHVAASQEQAGDALPVSAPEPNLDVLRSLDLAALAELRDALGVSGGGGGEIAGLGVGSPPPASPSRRLGALEDACGSPDSLTNLLVYQYLMESLPGGAGTAADDASHARSTGGNAALQALLGDRVESRLISTRVTVSTSLTTSTVLIDPTTRFLTSSTTYTTTVTNTDTKVIPVIFRGSKVTTTFFESSTEVIVATEVFTSSTVGAPTIVQTLPVHITLTATSTKGFDGRFTLADLVPGASSVLSQPIATATVDLDATGLLPQDIDIRNMDLSNYDLTSLAGTFGVSDNDQMVSALSALIQQYGIEPPKQVSTRVSSSSSRKTQGGRKSKISDSLGSFDDDIFVDQDEPPKFNVIKGFTLSDRPAPRTNPRRNGPPRSSGGGSGSGGGSAATATRYSKYHKKPKPENNGIAAKSRDSDRESERYSASTRRRTFSQATGRSVSGGSKNRQSPSNRFVAPKESQYFDSNAKTRPRAANSKRNNRNIESSTSRRRSSLTQDLRNDEKKNTIKSNQSDTSSDKRLVTLKRFTSRGRLQTSVEKVLSADLPEEEAQTTVLTMFVSGSAPGDFSKVLRTITLRGLQSKPRSKRHVASKTTTPKVVDHTASVEYSNEPQYDLPAQIEQMKPEDVVKILKTLDENVVRRMLKSLSKWVNYYTHELVDEPEIPDSKQNSEKPMLQASFSSIPESGSLASKATSLLPSHTISSPAEDFCSPPTKTITETVYHTVNVVPS